MRKTIPVLFLLGTLAALPRPASATMPCQCEWGFVSPPNDATGVPTNVRLLVSWKSVDASELGVVSDDATAATVPVTVTRAGSLYYQWWVIPDAELEPRTAYQLVGLTYEDYPAYTPYPHRFVTGDGPDGIAPTYSNVMVFGTGGLGACERSIEAAGTSVVDPADDQTPPEALIVRLSVTRPDEDGFERVLYVLQHGYFGDSGTWGCFENFQGAEVSHDYQARVTVVDWAGNPSAETAPITFRFERSGPCGCATSEPGPGGALPSLLLALVALAWIRRPRAKASAPETSR